MQDISFTANSKTQLSNDRMNAIKGARITSDSYYKTIYS